MKGFINLLTFSRVKGPCTATLLAPCSPCCQGTQLSGSSKRLLKTSLQSEKAVFMLTLD